MKTFVAAAFVASLSVAAAVAQSPELSSQQQRTVDRLIDQGLEDDVGWELLESLTTEIGPRLGGSPDEARAREWGARKLKQLGFKNVRIETFEMPYWERVTETAEIVSPYPQELKITALGNSVATPEGGVAAEVVRFRTLLDLQDAPLEGYEGKIIFVDEVMSRTQDGSGYGWAVAKRSGAANEAAKRGAVAAIIRSAGTSHGRTPHTGNMRYSDDVSPVPIAALSNPDADLLGLAMKRADGPVTVSVDISVHTKTVVESGNVIGEIPGKSDEIILIGGHLDSWDLGTGAVDDGAGIAITTAAAKLIDDLPGKPNRTIRVIMWGSEEVGLLGAFAYAEAHADELDRHLLASESDFGAGKVWQFRTGFAEEHLPKAQVYQKALRRLGIGPGNNQAGGGPDVTPLRRAGVPVFRLYQDGSDYFDLHHTMEDTLDKVDPEALRQNIAAWAATVYVASELEGDYRASESE
ncbi:M20/M25/M40 family metallo-hydrolase [Hyphococcus flavus]|uniref:Carboxypeptidase Q n=1 Tax=Hyphococcus flavus TaxID=1866326 RepID=A0AAE9ZDI3_9PROT|nr:M20/M25/M40 family metallo-hydrolase [Hyphococcus flavus]WDI32994.1 M20/M25/M40 family metallo-hydrolase [Hyphococcus flavus]